MVALEGGQQVEATDAGMASVNALKRAMELEGNVHLRELGFSMRHAIDALGREDLREEYDKVVQLEVESVMNRLPISDETASVSAGNSGKRWWWPF